MPGIRAPGERVPGALQQLPQAHPLLPRAPRVPQCARESTAAPRVAFSHWHAPFRSRHQAGARGPGRQALAPLHQAAEPDRLYSPPGVVVYSEGRYDLLPSSSAY